MIVVNLLLLFFYKEPAIEKKKDETLSQALNQIVSNTVIVLKDTKFVLFLLIMVGFWMMYMQLFFTVPVYITQWVDTSVIYHKLGFLQTVFGSVDEGMGVIRPEMMINIPAFTIILFQVIISNNLSKIAPIRTMIIGILIVAFAFLQMRYVTNGWFIALGLVTLAFGEMLSSPRIQEYISRIAPKEKVALYMGYSFLPLAGGNLLGGLLSGKLYGSLSDKYTMLRDYMVLNGHYQLSDIADMDDAVLFNKSLQTLDMNALQLNQILYNVYQPGSIWLVFVAIGLGTAVLLFLYNRFILKE